MKKKQRRSNGIINKLMLCVIDLIWIIGFITIVSSSLYLTDHINNYLLSLEFINRFIVYGLSIFCFINLYIIITGILFRIFVPKIKPGRAKVGLSKKHFYWRMNWHFYSYVFLFFKKYTFYNRIMRYTFLRLFRVNIKYSTYLAETVDLQDANNLLTIGRNSGLGSEVIIATHLALSPKVVIFREVNIGDNTHIQSRASIAPGVTIGNQTMIGFDTVISINVTIGNNTRVGARCSIDTGVTIGSNCRIGQNVYLGAGISIRDQMVIPDGSKILNSEDLIPLLTHEKEVSYVTRVSIPSIN
ncbi:DapH/DapD/GlmU-related protein [Haloplasma contractile]|uniref:UDP-3-O-acylglucosamine N-acyltransferase protein n=1 Tax=Haloplasma contractile SSD-17B TaxID=1033810 RepID=U2DQM8_9MOLU|nr:DapH/DapD/GlmU-related protein [Haloplasma contractile]ERJ10912.1 UDP-3-O-acylglucosamine N-acyltransferase protein [Haloplasma contractile SSD-17B]